MDALWHILPPVYLQAGVAERYLSTTLDFTSSLPAFSYSGFVLDAAQMAVFSLGAGMRGEVSEDGSLVLRVAE